MTEPTLFIKPLPTIPNPNPCVQAFGPGPHGRICNGCALLNLRWASGRRYYKCSKRRMSSCEATDHRVGWDACAKFEEAS